MVSTRQASSTRHFFWRATQNKPPEQRCGPHAIVYNRLYRNSAAPISHRRWKRNQSEQLPPHFDSPLTVGVHLFGKTTHFSISFCVNYIDLYCIFEKKSSATHLILRPFADGMEPQRCWPQKFSLALKFKDPGRRYGRMWSR